METKANNVLIKAMTKDENFRVYAVNATGVVSEMQSRQKTADAATVSLGRGLVASLLLSASVIKGKENMTIRINGRGPVGGMVIDADANGNIKGYVQHPDAKAPKTQAGRVDVGKAVGKKGFLEVIKNQKGQKEPYTSNVQLASGKIGDDFTYYLAKSEQIPSAVGVSVDIDDKTQVRNAGGYLIQVMPNASDEAISKLEDTLKQAPNISQILSENPNPESLLDNLFGKSNLDILASVPVRFHCNCSKAQFAKDLAGIGEKDLKELINKDHGAEVTCNFCGNQYNFSEEELVDMLNKK